MNSSRYLSMNITDLRQKLRRSAMNKINGINVTERRKASDRRQQGIEFNQAVSENQRIWLTPGERTLIEDLYFLEDK